MSDDDWKLRAEIEDSLFNLTNKMSIEHLHAWLQMMTINQDDKFRRELGKMLTSISLSLNEKEKELIQNNRPIAAMREHRNRTGCGLKESKNRVADYLWCQRE